MKIFQLSLFFSFYFLASFHLNAQLPEPPVPLPAAEEEIYKVVEEMPRFPGCEQLDGSHTKKVDCAKGKMLEYIYENLQYPEVAKENNVEGMAVIQFKIWKDSTIRDIKIVRNPGAGTGEEAARLVASMKNMDTKWTPGHQRGRPVCVQYTLPIKFKLEENFNRRKRYTTSFDIVHISDVHENPVFPDCYRTKYKNCTSDKLEEFVKDNQLYPQKALKNKTEGIVKIEFIIEKDGTLSRIKALNNLPDGLSEDAVEVFEWMNSEDMRWTPGKKNYRAVRTLYYIDVVYDIEDWNSRD